MKTISTQWQKGSVLLESLISILIFSIGLLGLVGLAAQALNQSGQSKARNDASNLASELIGDMWISASAPVGFDTTTWQARVAANLPGGTATVTPSGTQVAIVITWADAKNAGVRHQYSTTAQITKN
jgi:type IV pilus assembly protein PilV